MSSTTVEKVEKTEKIEKAKKVKGKAAKSGRKNPVIAEMLPLGQRIKQARDSKQMTQADLAEKLGTSTQDIGQVEQGWRSMAVTRVFVFAKALGVSPEWIFTGISPQRYVALVAGAKKFAKAIEGLEVATAPATTTEE